MNIGYVMIGTILLYVVTNLVTILVVGMIEICAFFRKCCCKKGKERYQVDTSFKDTTEADLRERDKSQSTSGKKHSEIRFTI